jgi:ribonuclease HII
MKKLLPRGDVKKTSLTSGWIVGLDEVGAGCLAGPLCVAAFAFPVEKASEIKTKAHVFDSKQLKVEQRESASKELKILPHCLFKICWIDVAEIETINIFWARMKAFWLLIFEMEKELKSLANYLVDGPRLNRKREIPEVEDELVMMELERRIFPHVEGDAKFFAIAAASIIAKVERDSMIGKLDRETFSSRYMWEKNKAYATPEHIDAIKKHGLTKHHRKTFCENILANPEALELLETL